MNSSAQYLLLALVSLLLTSDAFGYQLPNGGKIWTLLVAGSNGYDNYRHQADVCHAYQILHKNGIPDENIIVMMYDDIAYNSENPYPGRIINRPNGTDVYHGVLKDYTGKDVTPKNFLHILKGEKAAMKGIGSGRVIESGPNDHIFVNFVDHGASGLLAFPEEELYAKDLITALKEMTARKRFAKMVMYVEACESGSMFEKLLPEDWNIFAVTAASSTESSYACYCENELHTCLGDVFSVEWMNDTERENLLRETLHDQYEIVRSETIMSHVEEYGELDIGSMHMSEFVGFRTTRNAESQEEFTPIGNDVVLSRDVPIARLRYKMDSTEDPAERKEYSFKIHKMLKYRRHLEQTVDHILLIASGHNEALVEEVKHEKLQMELQHFDCYKNLVSTFSKQCFKISDNPHSLSQLYIFANICIRTKINEDSIIRAMKKVCSSQTLLKGVH